MNAPRAEEETKTGLPIVRTWRGVYVFVLGTFVLWLVLLGLLMRRYA